MSLLDGKHIDRACAMCATSCAKVRLKTLTIDLHTSLGTKCSHSPMEKEGGVTHNAKRSQVAGACRVDRFAFEVCRPITFPRLSQFTLSSPLKKASVVCVLSSKSYILVVYLCSLLPSPSPLLLFRASSRRAR